MCYACVRACHMSSVRCMSCTIMIQVSAHSGSRAALFDSLQARLHTCTQSAQIKQLSQRSKR